MRYRHLALAAVGEGYHVGVAIEELAPGMRSNPAHYHIFEEEHVYVLEGSRMRVGRVIGVLTLTPYEGWRRATPTITPAQVISNGADWRHRHADSARVPGAARTGVGSVPPVPTSNRDVWHWSGISVHLAASAANGTDAQRLAALAERDGDEHRDRGAGRDDIWLVGVGPFLLVQVPMTLLAASIGVWLFYVQHQFEDTSGPRGELELSRRRAARQVETPDRCGRGQGLPRIGVLITNRQRRACVCAPGTITCWRRNMQFILEGEVTLLARTMNAMWMKPGDNVCFPAGQKIGHLLPEQRQQSLRLPDDWRAQHRTTSASIPTPTR